MAVDVGEALTRKLGPLPAWGWGIGIGGAILAVRVLRGGSIGGGGGGGEPQRILVPTGGGANMAGPDFVSDLGTAIGQLRDTVANLGNKVDDLESQVSAPTPSAPTTPTPSAPTQPTTAKPNNQYALGISNYVRALRRLVPQAAALFPEKQTAGETAAARQERLQRERDYLEAAAGVGDYSLTAYIQGLRRWFPDIARQFGEREHAGETAAQRIARLQRERKFIEQRAGIGVTTAPNSNLAFSHSGIGGKPLGATGPAEFRLGVLGRGRGV